MVALEEELAATIGAVWLELEALRAPGPQVAAAWVDFPLAQAASGRAALAARAVALVQAAADPVGPAELEQLAPQERAAPAP